VLLFLKKCSGFFFYLLGLSFFVAYAFIRNRFHVTYAAEWMQVADLPLAFSAVVYGGTSLYLSLTSTDESAPRALPWIIGVPLAVIFGLILAMNFWR
jgi:hypothetical protein